MLYKCQWNKWTHFTTSFPLCECVCMHMLSSPECLPFIPHLDSPSCLPCSPWLKSHFLNERPSLGSYVFHTLFTFVEPLVYKTITILKNTLVNVLIPMYKASPVQSWNVGCVCVCVCFPRTYPSTELTVALNLSFWRDKINKTSDLKR